MKKIFKIDLWVKFFHELDNNGGSTWNTDSRKILIIYYHNDKNNNLNEMLKKPNSFAINLNIREKG